MPDLGGKIGRSIGHDLKIAVREAVDRAEKLLTERELSISLAGLDLPFLKDVSIRIGLEPKR